MEQRASNKKKKTEETPNSPNRISEARSHRSTAESREGSIRNQGARGSLLDEITFPNFQRKSHAHLVQEDHSKPHQSTRETFKAKISRLKSTAPLPKPSKSASVSRPPSKASTISKKSLGKKRSLDAILAEDVNSDYDLAYGRPKALRGYYFNLEWWWMKFSESGTHRTLVLLSALLFTLALAHGIFAIILLSSNDKTPDPYFCKTPGCTLAVERITSTIMEIQPNESSTQFEAHACNDFYAFVCGSYVYDEEETDLPDNPDKTIQISERAALRIDSMHYNFLRSRSLGKMLRRLAHASEEKSKPLKFYQSCMDRKRRQNSGLNPLIELLRRYDLFSVDDSQTSQSNIGATLARLYRDMVITIPVFQFVLEANDTKEYSIIRSTYTAVQSIFLYDVATYRTTMRHLLEHVGKMIPELKLTDKTEIDNLVRDLTCMELALFHYFGTDRVKVEGELDCPVNLTLSAEEPKMAATEYKNFLIELLKDEVPDIESWTELNNTHNATEATRKHRKYLDRAISGFYKGSRVLTVRLLQWRVLVEYASDLDETMFNLECPIKRIYTQCSRLSACFWSMFEIFPQEATLDLVNSLKKTVSLDKELKYLIDSIVDESVKAARSIQPDHVSSPIMFNKLIAEAFNVSVQTLIHDQTHVIPEQEMYAQVQVGPDYFENVLAFRKFQGRTHVLSKLGHEKESKWISLPKHQVDLYTPDLEENILAVPLGAVEEPYFQSKFPALDLSGLGFSMASAISRLVLLDQFSRQGDSFRLEKAAAPAVTWLESLDEDQRQRVWQAYDNSMKTLIVQLITKLPQSSWMMENQTFEGNASSYVLKSIEKILSDAIAVNAAYKVHETYRKRSSRHFNQKLPSLGRFTPQQLFFINLVSMKCVKYTPAKITTMLKNGTIPTPMAVNLILSNSEEFAESFNCPLNTPMNVFNKINFYEPYN